MINIAFKRVSVRPCGAFDPDDSTMSWDELRRKYHPSRLEMIRLEFK